ncbi:MAG: HAMP domain-containing sensor histidine kinase [bacterium]
MTSFIEEYGLPGTAGLFGMVGSGTVVHTFVRTKSGDRQPVRVTVVPIDIDGESHGFHCFFEDATHLYAVERQILLLQRAQSLRPLARSLARSIAAASRGLQTMVRWTRGERVTVEDAKQATVVISRALRRSGMLADDLRLFQQALKGPPDTSNVNVIVKRVVDFVQRLEPPGITVEEECSSEDLLVFTQPAELEQVLINLSLNAIEAMPDGGVLRMGTERIHSEQDSRPTPIVRITVTDTGKGIDPRIAQADLNARRIPEERKGQPGLGLVISQRVLRYHGGQIALHRLDDRGTRAEIMLPLRIKSDTAKVSTSPPARAPVASAV